MATPVTDPYTELADVLESTILLEFDDITYLTVVHDRIHESLGHDGITYVGISPDDQNEVAGTDLQTDVTVQFYCPWNPEVNPNQTVDPRIATTYAERLRRALREVRTTGSPTLWFFDVVRVRYPADPTGNKSRFEMSVRGRGNNTGLIETIG